MNLPLDRAMITYVMSPVSSYSYVAGLRLEQIADRNLVGIHYCPIDIVALFARTGGRVVAERHPSRQAYRAQDLHRLAERAGLPLNLRPLHLAADPTLAACAIIAAQITGGGETGRLAHGLLRAFWGEDRDIADPQVIRAQLIAAGFDPDAVWPRLAAAEAVYHANLEWAVAQGVFGAPSYLWRDRLFWGQDRLDFLDAQLAGQG